MGVNAGTTFTRPTMKGGSGSEGEAEEALGSSGIGDREHGTMMRGGDSSEGKVGTLMGVREDEGTVSSKKPTGRETNWSNRGVSNWAF